MIGSKKSIKCSVCGATIRMRKYKYIKDGEKHTETESRVMALDRHYNSGHKK